MYRALALVPVLACACAAACAILISARAGGCTHDCALMSGSRNIYMNYINLDESKPAV